jgi:autotransporter family porin
LSRFLFSDRVLAQSTPLHSVHLLAAGVLSAGTAQAQITVPLQVINIDETVTIPPPPHQDYNGHLNIGAGHDGTLNILQDGLVTVENDAVLGNSAGVTGTVNVTGPNATFSTVGDITVGKNGAGILTVNNGLVQSRGSIFLGSAQGSNKETGIITAVNGATIESQTNGITAEPTATVGVSIC